MFKIDLPILNFPLLGRECRNNRDSLIQRLLCWLFGCCPDEAMKGNIQ